MPQVFREGVPLERESLRGICESGASPPQQAVENLLSARLLKKVQMQGGAPGTRPPGWVRRKAYLVRTSQRRVPIARWATHPEDGYPADGLFSAAYHGDAPRRTWPGEAIGN